MNSKELLKYAGVYKGMTNMMLAVIESGNLDPVI